MSKEADRRKEKARRVRERLAKDQQKAGFKFNFGDKEVTYFTPKTRSKLILLPYVVSIDNHPDDVKKGDTWYRMKVDVHYGIGPEKITVVCPKTIGKPCPICEYRAALSKDTSLSKEEMKEEQKATKSSTRVIYNVIDAENEDKGVMFWEMAYNNFEKLLVKEMLDGDEENMSFFELDGGKILKCRFSQESFSTGEGTSSKYFEIERIDFEERDDLEEDLLEEVFQLDTLPIILSYEEILKIFNGEPVEEDSRSRRSSRDEEDEEEESKSSRRSRRDPDEEDEEPPKKNRKKEDEEEEEEPRSRRSRKDKDEEDEEEAEEEEEPRSRRSRRDPDEEDEEDEEPPKKSTKKKVADDECPYGYEFGTDCNQEKECEKCDNWEACCDLLEEIEKKEKEDKEEKKGSGKRTRRD